MNHGQVLDAAASTRAAKQLVEHYGGDPSSADWRHFGRLAEFTNPKRKRPLPSGMRPFARLRSATGHVYARAAEFLADIRKSSGDGAAPGAPPRKDQRGQKEHVKIRPLDEFHTDPTYPGDRHRVDVAWAKHAAGCGLTLQQIKDELLNGRDLGKKAVESVRLNMRSARQRRLYEEHPSLLDIHPCKCGRMRAESNPS